MWPPRPSTKTFWLGIGRRRPGFTVDSKAEKSELGLSAGFNERTRLGSNSSELEKCDLDVRKDSGSERDRNDNRRLQQGDVGKDSVDAGWRHMYRGTTSAVAKFGVRGDTRDEDELVGDENDKNDVGPGRRLLALALLLVRRRGLTMLGVGVVLVELGLSIKNDLECGEDPNGSDLRSSLYSSCPSLSSELQSSPAPPFGRANSSSILNGDGLIPFEFPALELTSA